MYLEEKIADLLNRVEVLEREAAIPRCSVSVLDQIRGIQNRVAIACGVDLESILGDSHLEHLVWPRHVAMYMVMQHVNASRKLMGDCFRREHSTLWHAVRAVRNRVAYDKVVARQVQTLEKLILEFKSARTGDMNNDSSPASAEIKDGSTL